MDQNEQKLTDQIEVNVGQTVVKGTTPDDVTSSNFEKSPKSFRVLIPSIVVVCLILAGTYLYRETYVSGNRVSEVNESTSTSSDRAASSSTIDSSLATHKEFDSQEFELKAKQLRRDEKLNQNGFLVSYVEGVRFLETSDISIELALKSCLLNIYQNHSHAFSCTFNGIEFASSSPRVTTNLKYLNLYGTDADDTLYEIPKDQIPDTKSIYYSNGAGTKDTLVVSKDFAEKFDYVGTRHDGRHFLGGVTGEPLAHLVTYIDLDDPFSKQFYPTLLALRKAYTVQELTIEVQHLPVVQLHPNAGHLAHAAHCAADQGDSYYWLFIQEVFEQKAANNPFDMNTLPNLAKDLGLNTEKFQQCTDGEWYGHVVVNQANTIVATGARGTPHTLIFNRVTGESVPTIVEGVQSVSELQTIIDPIVKELK